MQSSFLQLFAMLVMLGSGCDTVVSNSTHEAPIVDIASQLLDHRKPNETSGLVSDWPQLFGPNRSSFSSEVGLKTDWQVNEPREAWRVTIGTGYSSPIVVDGRVILQHRQGDEESIECLASISGETQWKESFSTNFKCKYEYSSGPYSTPLVHKGMLYAVSAEAHLRCLSIKDGNILWQRDLKSEYQLEEQLFGFGTSPIIVDDLLILNVGAVKHQAGIVAFDRLSGETRWTATSYNASYATPVVCWPHGSPTLLVLTYEALVSLDAKTGKIHWEEPFQSRSADSVNATSPAVWQDMVIVMQGPGPGARCWRMLPDGSHELVWKDRRVLDSQFNSLLVHKGMLFGFTAKREGGSAFRCIEFSTGKLRWSFSSDIQRGSCLAADGRIILWGENGHLGALDLNDQQVANSYVRGEPLLERPCYSAPALANGYLYLRNENHLVAYDLRADLK